METATHGTDGSTPPQPGVGTHAQPPSDDAPPAAVGGDVTGDIGMVVRYPEEMFNEAMDKSLLGLPASAHGIVERVIPFHTALFAFNTTRRTLHGVFEAIQPGGLAIEPKAFTAGSARSKSAKQTPRKGSRQQGDGDTPYPAQVRFHVVQELRPLPEALLTPIFQWADQSDVAALSLNEHQVSELMNAFLHQR